MAFTALTALFRIAVALGFILRGTHRRGLRHAGTGEPSVLPDEGRRS